MERRLKTTSSWLSFWLFWMFLLSGVHIASVWIDMPSSIFYQSKNVVQSFLSHLWKLICDCRAIWSLPTLLHFLKKKKKKKNVLTCAPTCYKSSHKSSLVMSEAHKDKQLCKVHKRFSPSYFMSINSTDLCSLNSVMTWFKITVPYHTNPLDLMIAGQFQFPLVIKDTR